MSRQFFEDFAPGQKFASAPRPLDAAAIKAFAAEFDPQPFHLDETAAKDSLFGGLAASGWHTAAITMRLCLSSEFRPAGGIIGGGGELVWSKPVRAGDSLRAEIEVIETRASRSRPAHGLVTVRIRTLNQHGDIVQTFSPTLLVDRRPNQR